MQDQAINREEIASLVRREFLKGAVWLSGALVLGAGGAVLTACTEKSKQAGVEKIDGVSGPSFWKDQEGYEAARQAAVWVGNKPKRYPAVIVFPKNENDVIAAVKFAAAHKLKVGPRSGGHSWAAPHVQNDSMLLDLSTWNDFKIDAASKTAWVQPAVKSGAMVLAAAELKLCFPGGHNPDVALGGFLICGGFGRNSRQWGIGCENILEIECVDAKGELIRANENENPDFYWAARGAGPGFFGVVTRLKLKLHDLPIVIRQRIYVYDMADFDAVMRWSFEVQPKLPDYIEPMMYRRRLDEKTGDWGPDTFFVIAVGMGDSIEKVAAGLAPLETCPVRKRAVAVYSNDNATLEQLYARSTGADPVGWRFAVDGIWSNADPEQLIPLVRELFATVPTPRTYIYYSMWGPVKELPDMAMSMQARIYVAAHTRWQNPDDDDKMFAWTTQQMRGFEPYSVGSKLNDDAMVHRQAPYFTEAAAKRLSQLQAKYDPNGVFLSFLKLGDPF